MARESCPPDPRPRRSPGLARRGRLAEVVESDRRADSRAGGAARSSRNSSTRPSGNSHGVVAADGAASQSFDEGALPAPLGSIAGFDQTLQRDTHCMEALHSAIKVKDFLMSEFLHRLAVGGTTLSEVKEHLDLAERESDLLGSFDEPKKGDAVGAVGAVSRVPSRRLRQEPSPLVIAECLDVDAGFLCDLSCFHLRSLDPVPKYRVKPKPRRDRQP